MDWSNEDYVRLYRRVTDDDLLLSWEARAVWHEMLKKFDRSGLLETRRGMRGLAALLHVPRDVVERVIPELLEDGRIQETPTGYFAKNFLEAQEAPKSDRLRARESRIRRRDAAAGTVSTTSPVTICDESSRGVTPGHALSHDVTLTCPSLAKPSQAKPSNATEDSGLKLALVEPAQNGEPKPRKPPSDGQRAIDHFAQRYRTAYATDYDWGPEGRDPKQIRDLVKKWGLDEVIRRTDLLFDGKGPTWLKPPFTVSTLKSQWNALAQATAPARAHSEPARSTNCL